MGFLEGLSKWLSEEVPLPWGNPETAPTVDEKKVLDHKIDVIVRVLIKYFENIDESKWVEELAKSKLDLLTEVLTILEQDALKAIILNRLVQNKAIKALKPKGMDEGEYPIEVMKRINRFKDSLLIARSR